MPWLLATLTLALALAGPAYADSLGAEEMAEAEAVLAAEIPEAPLEEPPEPSEPVIEPAEAPPTEPAEAPPTEPAEAPPTEPAPAPVEAPAPEAPAPVEAPAPEPEAAPAEEPLTSVETPAPEPAAPAEEMAAEPVVDDSDVESPAPAQPGADEPAPSVVVPLNLNVDIRILSPGDDGDVTQVIDMGQLPGRGGGNPADVLGDAELGLDWTWNWTWDCGDASVAGLDWNWSWSGDCAGGMMDDEPSHEIGPFGERSRSERYPGFPDGLDLDAPNAPPELDVESGPVVTTPGFDRSPPAERDERDEARTTPAPPSGGGGLPTPALTTSFASTGAPSQSSIATAPARRPAGADPTGDPERRPAGPPAQAMGLASVAAAAGGGGGGGLTVLLLAALIGALTLLPPPSGGRIRAYGRTLSSLLSSSRLERPG